MTDPSELVVALTALSIALDSLPVTWAIGGSLASAAHGEPRATNDVDVIAPLTESNAPTLCERLGADFYADADMAREAARNHGSFNVLDQRSFLKIDIFVPREGPLGLGQLQRRRFIEILPGLAPVPILGAEDVVLQKLRWYQMGDEVSDRQWRDLVSVLRHCRSTLDEAYLDAVASATGLASLLERARRDAK